MTKPATTTATVADLIDLIDQGNTTDFASLIRLSLSDGNFAEAAALRERLDVLG